MSNFMRHNWFPALFALLIFAPGTWWLFDVEPPVEIRSITATADPVRRGGNLLLNYDVIRKRECPGETQRVFADSRDTVHAAEPYRFNSGAGRDGRRLPLGPEVYQVSAPVPFGAAPGPAKFQATVEYWCNPLQRFFTRGIIVTMPVVSFTILPDVDDSPAPPLRLPEAQSLDPAATLNRPPLNIIERLQ